jgi:hypothetical protein
MPVKPRSTRTAQPRQLLSTGRLFALAFLTMIGLVGGPLLFVTSNCYGDGFQPPMRRPPAARDIPNYTRDEAYTYLALPQWIVIYSADDYARHLAKEPPSTFPYFQAIGQFWRQYEGACTMTQNRYQFDADLHSMLAVVGTALTVESFLKGLYENSIGWITEQFGSHDTAEDKLAARIASEYGTFTHTEPWYEYPFADQLVTLWTATPLVGLNPVRKVERRLMLTAELAVKTVWASIVGIATSVAYAADIPQIHVWIERAPESVFSNADIVRVAPVGPQAHIVKIPRGEVFTKHVLSLHAAGVRFVSIGGNDDVMVSVIRARPNGNPPAPARVLTDEPLLTDPDRSRLALSVPVASLNDTITHIQATEGIVEHIYDY